MCGITGVCNHTAALGVKFGQVISEVFSIDPATVAYFTDSTDTLWWI